MTTDRSPFIASALGLPRFPGETAEPPDNGHIMGVVVLAWLTQHPVRAWGDDWAERGTMRLRYRQHLSAGTPLTIGVAGGNELSLDVEDGDGQTCADGTAGLAAVAAEPEDVLDPSGSAPPGRSPPFPEDLRGRVLHPLEFPFDADRDLSFVDELADGDYWRGRRWAHPAWIASGANAVLSRSIAFEEGGYWRHAGSELRNLRPIPSGSLLRLHGRIDELFQASRHRFGIARIVALADGIPAAIHRVTFVYGAAPGAGDDHLEEPRTS